MKAPCCCVTARGAGCADAASRTRLELLAALHRDARLVGSFPQHSLPAVLSEAWIRLIAPRASFDLQHHAPLSARARNAAEASALPATAHRCLRRKAYGCRSATPRANTGIIHPYWTALDEDSDGRRDPCIRQRRGACWG
jgi:hypothetical protein